MLRLFFPRAFFAATLFVPAAAWACAVCLTGVSANDPVADAFSWSVLFLMAAPYTIVGSIGGWIAYTHWLAAKKRRGPVRGDGSLRLAWMNKESGR